MADRGSRRGERQSLDGSSALYLQFGSSCSGSVRCVCTRHPFLAFRGFRFLFSTHRSAVLIIIPSWPVM
ncbi:hypothetical protein GE061_011609 [Apolygus lucorum]|uniref:Uncharacterized protein n=1 Tax=Apolygus lucorum TaxID=248454 RepID=A0A8S9XZ58_APOLU|nr:hypothetical protein GE061_011609 [Apolygus lucorum]